MKWWIGLVLGLVLVAAGVILLVHPYMVDDPPDKPPVTVAPSEVDKLNEAANHASLDAQVTLREWDELEGLLVERDEPDRAG